MKSPSAVRAVAAPIAAPFVSVGRIIEQIGNFLAEEWAWLRHDQIVLQQLRRGFCSQVRKVTNAPVIGSVSLTGVALPALSCQV